MVVFFIDDRQIVRPNEIGSTEYIKKWDFEGSALTYSIIRYGDVLAQEASKLAASPAPAN